MNGRYWLIGILYQMIQVPVDPIYTYSGSMSNYAERNSVGSVGPAQT